MQLSATYARVSVNVPQITGTFDYSIPDTLLGKVHPGSLVEVPFGSQAVQGIVLGILDQPAVEAVKPLSNLVDPKPVITPAQIELSHWLEPHSIATLSQCINLMILPGIKQFADTLYFLHPETAVDSLPPDQARLLKLFTRSDKWRGRQIDRALPKIDWQPAVRKLIRKGIISSESFLPRPGLHPKLIKKIQLACKSETIDFNGAPFKSSSPARTQARVELMRYLCDHPEPVDLQWLRAQIQV